MINMRLDKNPMPCQDPNVRNKNFKEVTTGYTEEMAIDEAKRCLNCKNPLCMKGCPVNIHIPAFIQKVTEGKFEEAFEIISLTSSLPAVCGRVCPQESQCEGKCVRGLRPGAQSVGIGRLERFVADYHNAHSKPIETKIEKNGHKVAIVGSGPSGLTCAGDLIKLGYDVTIYEALHKAGGVLVYGIPEFRLPKSIVEREVENLKSKGVKIVTNAVIGKAVTIDELLDDLGYDAVFVGSGAGLPRFMGIPGENLKGVFSANEILTRVNLMKGYLDNAETPIFRGHNVAVVGGGNVAMDACRSAKRLGAENVYIIYRRSLDELPARKEEVEHAMEEGIIFKTLTNPTRLIGDEEGNVKEIEVVDMELGEPDSSGRRKPIVKAGSEHIIPMDCVIMALGTSPNPLIKSTTKGLEANAHGCLIADENGKTTREGVFAGGDAVTGAATVILAMGAGKTAAKAIDEYIKGKAK